MYAKKNSGMKVVATLLAIVLLIGVGVGGTLAWLSATTETVTNTFTVGDVNIDLKETVEGEEKSAKSSAVENTDFHILPGVTQAKDPKVVVEANSENSWVFVQIKEVNNTVADNASVNKYVEWTIAQGWTQLGETTSSGVSTYYRTSNYDKTSTEVPYYVLGGDTSNANGKVSYNDALTKADIDALGEKKPQLIFKAFAVQEVTGDNVNTAWEKIAANQKLS